MAETTIISRPRTNRWRRNVVAIAAILAALVGFGFRALDANAVETLGDYQVNAINASHLEFGANNDLMHVDADFAAMGLGPADYEAANEEKMIADFTNAKDAYEKATGWDLDNAGQRQQMNDEAQAFLSRWQDEKLCDSNPDSGCGVLSPSVEESLGNLPQILDELTESGPVNECRSRCLTYGWRSFALTSIITAMGIVVGTGLVVTGSAGIAAAAAVAAAGFLIGQAWSSYVNYKNNKAALAAAKHNKDVLTGIQIMAGAAWVASQTAGANAAAAVAQTRDANNAMAKDEGFNPAASDMLP